MVIYLNHPFAAIVIGMIFLTPFLNVVAYPLKLLGTFICMPEFFNILKLFMNILIYRLLSTCKTNTMFTGKFCYKSASENAA